MFVFYSLASLELGWRSQHTLGDGSSAEGSCPPESYAAGHWSHQPRFPAGNVSLTQFEHAFLFNEFEGCASSREYWWHLGADSPDHWDRYPDVTDYKWVPGEGCQGLREFNSVALVKHLVEEGGWLLLGDSISENHFFSLSCLLYPHVRATPYYAPDAGYDHGWPQNLYLSPTSPLVLTLNFPPGFSIEHTPLVTHRRVDLLLTQPELETLHTATHPELYPPLAETARPLVSEVPVWTMSPKEYLPLFTAPAPDAHYATMIVSTAGHWTTRLFSGLDGDRGGIGAVLAFFRVAVRYWATQVEEMLTTHLAAHAHTVRAARRPRVIVRAYLPGHVDCHSHRQAWSEYVWPAESEWNWASIGEFNRIFQEVVSEAEFPDIDFLAIDRPGLLRPDAHVNTDCLHMMAGAGVIEGWTHYIWHFLTREQAR
ncbi:hypothetical protein DENSPDRAFT_779180 [Dentipellis sp. KUC8613]|nr:hypothetical protein DENSPDRAFT_779180 [Dentipellis sp. KUC8613]